MVIAALLTGLPLLAITHNAPLTNALTAIFASIIVLVFVGLTVHMSRRSTLTLTFVSDDTLHMGESSECWRIGRDTRIGLVWVWLHLQPTSPSTHKPQYLLFMLSKLSDTARRSLGYRISLSQMQAKEHSCRY